MSQAVILVLLVLCVGVGYSASGHRHLRSVIGAILESRPPSVAAAPAAAAQPAIGTTSSCSGCAKKYALLESDDPPPDPKKFSITKLEFTALRIEYIKNQILKKLRLKEKPQVSMPHLPQPVAENDIMRMSDYEFTQNTVADDFYGKTTQAIIFPYEDEVRCVKKSFSPSACIPFEMPDDITAADISSAELWFHKEADVLDGHNQTFVISEVTHWDSNKSFQKTKPIAIQETGLTKGWINVDVAYVIKNWLDYQDSRIHAINVACKTCGMEVMKSPISFKPALKPFLVIHTHSHRRRPQYISRPKRQINCHPGSHECCRESLYIRFADIGWDDWIIRPPGYNAYFCTGSCSTSASVTLSANQHSHILQKVMGSSGHMAHRLELTPCCAATQFQPLELFYMDSNKTLTRKTLPNMIVDSCGCM